MNSSSEKISLNDFEIVKKSYPCKECGKVLKSCGALYNHELKHKGIKTNMCGFCGKLFLTSGQLKIHERKHTRDKPFICQVCNKSFSHRQSLITHSTIHTGVRPFECENCKTSFSCIGNLLKHRKAHLKTCGQIPLKNHTVNNTDTYTKIKLNTPKTSKLKEPKNVIEDCNNIDKFNFQQSTDKDKDVVVSQLPFETEDSKQAIKCLKRPPIDRTFSCKTCGKKCKWKGQLKIHERSHTGEKPFTCLYCPKAFAYRESLLTHSTLHTGVKPHSCEICGVRFSCVGNLNKHKNRHKNNRELDGV